ncbi:hypothetical protein H0H87_000278, partial [Tephrocybe sp. NHM501043]
MAASFYIKFDNALSISVNISRHFHPEFSFPDANVIVRSFEGTLYRIHSYTLHTTSGLFNTMFSLPQPTKYQVNAQGQGYTGPVNEDAELEEIPIYESDFVLERLLCQLCSIQIPSWESYDDLDRVLTAAEKWDIPGPIASIRAALTCPKFLTSDRLRLYVLAKHFNWREEAKIAATQTLKLNLLDSVHASTLCDMFKELLISPERFAAGN